LVEQKPDNGWRGKSEGKSFGKKNLQELQGSEEKWDRAYHMQGCPSQAKAGLIRV